MGAGYIKEPTESTDSLLLNIVNIFLAMMILIHSQIHLFHKYFIPGTFPGTGDVAEHQKNSFYLSRSYTAVRNLRQINKSMGTNKMNKVIS